MSDLHRPPDDDQELDQPADSEEEEEEDGEEGEEGAFSTMEGRVQQATQVAQQVTQAALPIDAPATWNAVAHQELIIAILRDWSKNGTEELVEEDVTNLSGFTRIAAGAGMSAPAELHDSTFVAVLRALLEDWVANWSGGDEEED
ncbi:MAG: hypothetical protein J2P43_16810 [Candidatus Dormibacteraeota bacterium]|nr:hypothetical protein [Candidatus Dormibacteraeota bacterium]